jgi:formate dehydrogenase major subunit
MHEILAQGRHDEAFVDARVDPASFAQLRATVSQEKYRPENSEIVTRVSPERIRRAVRLMARPRKTSILFEKA